MKSPFIFLGALAAFTGVAFGAIGAHALKSVLGPEQMAIYHTAVEYQLWHALGLLCIGLLQRSNTRLLNWAGWLMASGILLFSGSLYAMLMFKFKQFGMITPFGGFCFLAAWVCLMIFGIKGNQLNHPDSD